MKASGDLYFDLFWNSYPKRVAKVCAIRAWRKVKESEYENVMQGLEIWKQADQWQDVQFIPYPATFLNQRRWEDEVPRNAGTKNDKRILRTLEAAKRIMESGPEVDGSACRTLSSGAVGTGVADLLRIPRKV